MEATTYVLAGKWGGVRDADDGPTRPEAEPVQLPAITAQPAGEPSRGRSVTGPQ